jgi:hypothetical protein
MLLAIISPEVCFMTPKRNKLLSCGVLTVRLTLVWGTEWASPARPRVPAALASAIECPRGCVLESKRSQVCKWFVAPSCCPSAATHIPCMPLTTSPPKPAAPRLQSSPMSSPMPVASDGLRKARMNSAPCTPSPRPDRNATAPSRWPAATPRSCASHRIVAGLRRKGRGTARLLERQFDTRLQIPSTAAAAART